MSNINVKLINNFNSCQVLESLLNVNNNLNVLD